MEIKVVRVGGIWNAFFDGKPVPDDGSTDLKLEWNTPDDWVWHTDTWNNYTYIGPPKDDNDS